MCVAKLTQYLDWAWNKDENLYFAKTGLVTIHVRLIIRAIGF